MNGEIFLTAEWRKLAFANYAVNPSLLKPYLPAGTELDLWNDKCYVSLVGFMFMNTRLKGIHIPFHINFEEVNLRFYVKRKESGIWKRGVTFIKEIVPKPAITFIANALYNEKYLTLPMRHSWKESVDRMETGYYWKQNKKWNTIQVITNPASMPIPSGSEEEFITEHYWGYAKAGENKTTEYQVRHPAWEMYKVQDFTIDVDFESLYGTAFSALKHTLPDSVMLAEGSAISIFSERKKIPAKHI